MSLDNHPYRVSPRTAAVVLATLLILAGWGLWSGMRDEQRGERSDMASRLRERSRLVSEQLEQTLSMAAFAAVRLRHPRLREASVCSDFLRDLVTLQPLVGGAAIRGSRGEPLCSSGRDAGPWLPLGADQTWRLTQRPDNDLQLDQVIFDSDGRGDGLLSLRLDAGVVGGSGALGKTASASTLRWLAEPQPSLATGQREPVTLAGRIVAWVEPDPLWRSPRIGLNLKGVASALLGCAVLTAAALMWLAARVLRKDSARLMRVALQPDQGNAIRAGIQTGALSEAASVIADEQLRTLGLSEQLRQASARLEEVQRVASIGSWRSDVLTGHIEWSAQTHAIFGVPHSEAVTLDLFLSHVHELDRGPMAEHRQRLIDGVADMDFAHRIVRAGGEVRVVHERGTVAARDAQGRPTALVGTVQDVTKAWEASSLTDALARALALSGDPVLLTREHAGSWFRAWSNGAWDRLCEQLQLLGHEVEHQLFNPLSGLLRAHVERAHVARARHQVLRLQLEVQTPSGMRWYDAELIPHGGAPGVTGHGLLLLRDRSAEYRAAAALRDSHSRLERTVFERTEALARSERQYRVLADLSPQILWRADGDGQVSYLNRSWHEMVGPREGGWMGLGWVDALHPDDVAPSLQAMRAGTGTRQPWQVRRRVKDRHGAYRSLLGVAAPVLGADGQLESWIGVDSDITELERHASRLQQLNAELETFSYTVSHDLRAPVHVIKGFVEALLSGQVGQIDDEARYYLDRVLRGALRMDELISDLLALARLARETLRLERFDPGVLVMSLVDMIRERYPDRAVECHASGGGLEIEGDRRLFQVALENLLDNAAKFSAGREACRIEFTWRREREEIVIEMADDGVGFPAAFAHRLFRPYQRLHSKADFPGNGIGLATVARIVQLHGGRISAHNREPCGAVFVIHLPVAVHALAGSDPVAMAAEPT